jgi:hypothetical protein
MSIAAESQRAVAGSGDLAQRKLGRNQVEFMELLKSHRSVWHPGSSWVWKAPSETVRILQALQRRGYADLAEDGKWRMTTEGRRALAWQLAQGG